MLDTCTNVENELKKSEAPFFLGFAALSLKPPTSSNPIHKSTHPSNLLGHINHLRLLKVHRTAQLAYIFENRGKLQIFIITSKIMVGWDDDAFHSQIICPSEDKLTLTNTSCIILSLNKSSMEMVGWCFNVADTKWKIWVCFEIHFAVVQCQILIRNEQQNIPYEVDAEDSARSPGAKIRSFFIKLNDFSLSLTMIAYMIVFDDQCLARVRVPGEYL
ncbi:hypothetical protein FRACYDRAFT_254665 [Fragilariopsis cylindrus CCMP1102]|uniref:Uncharacterized protein n=1 Tax=Fragilariopsis cylindrus CCMP1102 TaxID=635003 RepID=A0A1E7EKH0_9STRA|nr:hypothetical protein FRACYDRAFT_254665 [Fragilariopsis cylindrus CCMP1102]|eukprot:OEU06382.1 hypothetical protein FRACYDRAFT_254665 [Fragilariopsis cylindrus CCMP1102]